MNNPKDLHDYFLDSIIFGNKSIDAFGKYFHENASGIGTAAHERIHGRSGSVSFFKNQRKELEGLTVNYSRKLQSEKYFSNNTCFLVEEDVSMEIKEANHKLLMRVSVIYEKFDTKWLITQFHASTPDSDISNEEHFPNIGLQQKNAELEAIIKERTRELEIEAALERVRTASMAMHKSEELIEVVRSIKSEIGMLGIQTDGVLIYTDISWPIIDNGLNLWVAADGVDYYKKIHVPLDNQDPALNFLNAYKQGQDFLLEKYTKAEKNKYFRYLFKHSGLKKVPDERKKLILNSPGWVRCTSISKNSCLQFQRYYEQEFSNEDQSICRRFGSVFEQAYTRFLDLQKAEEQTREAQIEAALERVRAASMALYNSDEVGKAVNILFHELNSLGIAMIRCGVVIISKDKTMAVWTAANKAENIINISGKVDMDSHPMLRGVYSSWESGKDFYQYELKGRDAANYYEAISSLQKYSLPANHVTKSVHYGNAFLFNEGGLFVFTKHNISDLEVDIFSRFTKVFKLTYSRYSDLKKAEERARQAKIELALERIRAQATAMRKSSDLLDIVVTMRDQFVELGHEAHYFWHMKYNEVTYEKAMTSGDGAKIGMVMKLPRKIHSEIEQLAKWEKSSEKTIVFTMDVDAALDYVHKMIDWGDFIQVDPNAPTDKDIKHIQGLTYVMARTKHGEIGYSLPGEVPNPPEEAVKTLVRFAGAFDLAYQRFEDLQQAEIRARESQIEAAVERVRAEAMAMHHPSDLVNVTQILIHEITNLGIEGITGAAFMLVDENDIVTMWDISDPGNMGFTRDHKSVYDPKEFKMLGEFWRKWKKGEDYFVIKYDLEKNKKGLEEWKIVDEENYHNLKRAIEQNKLKTQWNPYGSFSKGSLTLDMMVEPDDDTKSIVQKMATTFDLAYQRFDDLQKAEEQAREAKKQASLDRIHAEIASMRNQRDLELITPLIWKELSSLDVPFFRCGVFIIDPDIQKTQVYLSTPGGESIAAITFDFDSNQIVDDAIAYWEEQKIYKTKWSREEFVAWSKDLLDQGLIPNVKSYQHNEEPPENLHLQFFPFKQGMLYIGSDYYLESDHMNLIQDMADDFSIAYSRYEDFVNLEKAKYQTETAYGELKSTQTQLIHAEKMASLGELTAGIAHEIQNPLNFVNNFSDLNIELVEELNEAIEAGDLEEVKEIVQDLKANEEKITEHGKRAEDIVRGMLQHSRGGDGKKELTDINKLADEYLRLAYHGLRAKDKSFNANFTSNLDKSLPKIEVVPQDIGRVFLNLINNAFHAVAERAAEGKNGYSPSVEVTTINNKENLEIIVKDNGRGIPNEIREKIFQPFFTTKPTGSGTGLGLSLSYDIVTKGHGGVLGVKSKEGKGSEFIINLPVE